MPSERAFEKWISDGCKVVEKPGKGKAPTVPPAFDRGAIEAHLHGFGGKYEVDVSACLREIDRQAQVIVALTAERDRYLEALRALSPAPVKKRKEK